MVKLSISQVAKMLSVNKKTLMRWDASGKFPAMRESLTGARYYDETDIKNHVLWFDVRRKHKAHLRKLGPIREAISKFINTTPLDPAHPAPVFDGKEMKKAFDSERAWISKEREIEKGYGKLPGGFSPKVDPES